MEEIMVMEIHLMDMKRRGDSIEDIQELEMLIQRMKEDRGLPSDKSIWNEEVEA